MHWTDLLSRRRFPSRAIVLEDLPCAGCGYNLRTLPARGHCPECGSAVGDSLFVFARPGELASGLRTLATSFLCTAGVLLMSALFACGLWVLPVLTIPRVIAAASLRYSAGIENMPILSRRVRTLWPLALAEVLLAICACVTLVLAIDVNASRLTQQLAMMLILLALLCMMAVMAVSGMLLRTLAQILGSTRIDRLARALIILVAMAPAGAAIGWLTLGSRRAGLAAALGAWLCLVAALGLGSAALWLTAGVISAARRTREDAVGLPDGAADPAPTARDAP
jgi:hypothetical protein